MTLPIHNTFPSVAYWTSALFPEMEAIAGEVALLRRHFRPSVAWGISSARWLQLSWRRGFGVHPRFHLAFRAATWALQRFFQVNHVFGGLGDWFHLNAARKHPTVLTVATEASPCDQRVLDRVDRFVIEWSAAGDQLAKLGIERKRIDLIFPSVDLERFRPTPFPEGPLTVLFASSPDSPDWLEARGIPLLLSAAERLPAVRFRLLWRPWGTAFDQVQKDIEARGLTNVELRREKVTDMAKQYEQSHLTVAPFTDMSRCKAMPNSLVESLAGGRPVVTTPVVGLAEIIRDEKCGRVCTASVEGICEAIESVGGDLKGFASCARQSAERWFGMERFVQSYQRVYNRVLCRSS